jgi:bifunctional non-homologous end joining protein LigD
MPPRKRTPQSPQQPLERYAEKRTFTETPEPGPALATARRGPLLFVIQKHAARRLHYDFRLELDGVLKSWAVPKGPALEPGVKRLAVEVEDHPFEYASFEGIIPAKQYGAGRVIVWDCGTYSPDEDQHYSFDRHEEAEERVRAGLRAGKLSILLRGEKLKGSFALVKTSGDKQWLLLKHKDRFVQSGDRLLEQDRSVLSGLTLEELTPAVESHRLPATRLAPTGPTEAMPQKLLPMLAEPGAAPPPDGRWLYEPKLDGYRVVVLVSEGGVRILSRRGLDLSDPFPEIVAELTHQAVDSMILDAEIVALAGGRPSFNALQNRAQLRAANEIAVALRETPVVLVCFDLLHFAGLNLRDAAYTDRRRYLAQSLLPSAHVQLMHATEDPASLYEAALANGFEGIVAKRKDSIYQAGKRSPAWRKVKGTRSLELLVGGYTRGKGAREPLGALLLGYWSNGALQYAGHVGSGLTQEVMDRLAPRLKQLARKRSPFAEDPPLHRPTTWLEPELVVEITFSDWTPDGVLRAPVFLRVREDIAPRGVRGDPQERRFSGTASADVPAREAGATTTQIKAILQQLDSRDVRLDLEVGGARIALTSLDREYWPATARPRHAAVTKRDFIRYLAQVSPFILPHLKDRPLTMIRMPEGIHGERFFQKHWEQRMPEFVETVTVFSGHKDEQHSYILANNLPTLLWLGQNGTLEFHVWHSRAKVEADAVSKSTDYASSLEALEASVLNYPDYLVFDIDPYIYSGKEPKGGEPELNPKGFAGGKEVAFWLHDLLAEMSLQAVVKTSGKTGLHVFVPIERTVTFDEARQICETVGRHVMRAHPRQITMEWAANKRTGKIFIDYNMNVRGKTLNVAYSPRGVPGAPVSMPLTWEELKTAEPMDFTLGNVIPRLESTGDRWHDVFSEKQSLAKAFGGNERT